MAKKKSPRETTPRPAVAATLTAAATAKLMRFTILLTVIVPLIDTFLIFPLRQIILANTGAGVLYQIVFQATELFNLIAFFLLIALAIYCAIADSPRTLGRIIALHGAVSVFVVVLLRLGVYYLMAWVDTGYFLPFDLCNQTLNTLTRNSGAELWTLALTLFISQVILFVLLVVMVLIAMHARHRAQNKKADLSPIALYRQFDESPLPKQLTIGLIIYTAFALGNQIFDTIATVVNLGAPDSFNTLLSLIVPYFLLAIYSLLGYLALDYGTRYIAKEASV
ncbi:MAG: hypothetical protein J6R82_07860 [Clostridia bacterium]|nr:hypothetical protein [Clostridia bacterium]